MDRIFLALFCATLFLCISTYVLYPIGIWLAAKAFPFRCTKADIRPTVSVIISAYNEEKHIEAKIRNTLSLDYPRDRIEIIVGSDGSTDGTAEIVRKFHMAGVRLIDFSTNNGKTFVQNQCVERSRGEVLVFMDAASMLREDAVTKLVRNFADPEIGCVGGKLVFVNKETNRTTESQGLYWRYELCVRASESRLGRMIGVDGLLYAMRRECYVPLRNHIISDLISPLIVLHSGKRVLLEPEAEVLEAPTERSRQELNTRRRITLRGLVGLTSHPELLNPIRNPLLAGQILFHKVLRWCVGPLVFLNLVSCLMLSGTWVFNELLVGYLLFFIAALLGGAFERKGIRWKILTIPYYFTLVNLAATLGIIDFLRGRQIVQWVPVR
jgi:cellulose synthase/poly-beta-1,6-N-acetylglucosamine synthase-like glycosyltransferase